MLNIYKDSFLLWPEVILLLSERHTGGSGWGGGRWEVLNSLISKNLAHYSLSLKFLLIL